MECLIKEGFKPDMMVGFDPKIMISDEFVDFNSQNMAPVSVSVSVSGEDFFVDQLLNLNDEEDDNGGLVVVKEKPLEKTETPYSEKLSVSPFETEQNRDDFGSVLSIPAEEAWLSQFVEESFSQFPSPSPSPSPSPAGPGPFSVQPKPEPSFEKRRNPCFVPPLLLSKSRRSKRTRTGGPVWPTVLTESPSVSSASFSSTTGKTTSSHPLNPNRNQTRPKKRRKKRGGSGCGTPRRCSHCGVQKTPQWRAGPNGSKTLCNACGVRYKSGRLLPEYRPACSPTFSSELHSNNHRKVLEMRRKKELMMAGRPESRLSHPVPTFG